MPQVPIWGCVLLVLAVAALCGALAFFAGVNHRKREAEAAIGSAEDEAKRIISNAIKTAAAKKKEAVLEGKDDRSDRILAERARSDIGGIVVSMRRHIKGRGFAVRVSSRKLRHTPDWVRSRCNGVLIVGRRLPSFRCP